MSSAAEWRKWEGRTVAGKFALGQWLGGTEHSAVFLAERSGQSAQGKKAAIKLVAADADAERQLSRWRSAAQLSHPHLIRIFESGRTQIESTPLLYVVMEYASEDLAQILPERALTPDEVADLLPPLLDALAYLHEKGFVHGDIKPSNLLVAGEQLKLSADEVTSAAGIDPGRTWRDVYDAPEIAAGTISPAADLWSLGLTLVAALTQKAPSGGEVQIPASVETLPEPFRGIARECLRLDPKRRCSIAQIQARLQPSGRSVPAAPELPPPPRRPLSKGAFGVAVAVVALLIGLFVFYPRGKNAPAASEPTREPATAKAAPASSTPKPVALTKKTGSEGEVVRQVLPDIPKSAMNTITGTIKIAVRVEVDSSGKVMAAKFVTRGPSQYFAERTIKAAQDWEFAPPEVNGQPAASTWLLRFRLRHSGIQASPEKLAR